MLEWTAARIESELTEVQGWGAVSRVSFRELYLKESVDTVPTHTDCELGMFFCSYAVFLF